MPGWRLAVKVRAQAVLGSAVGEHLVDQDFHQIDAEMFVDRVAAGRRLGEQEMVHAADLFFRIEQTGGHAGTQHGREFDPRAGADPGLALEHGDPRGGQRSGGRVARHRFRPQSGKAAREWR